jgi:hypothetical protein
VGSDISLKDDIFFLAEDTEVHRLCIKDRFRHSICVVWCRNSYRPPLFDFGIVNHTALRYPKGGLNEYQQVSFNIEAVEKVLKQIFERMQKKVTSWNSPQSKIL